MIRSTLRRMVKWAMDDPQQINYNNKLTINTIGSIEASASRDEEDRMIRRPGIVFTVYAAEGGTVIQCRSNNYGDNPHVKNGGVAQPRLYVIHDDAAFNDEVANIIHLERIRAL